MLVTPDHRAFLDDERRRLLAFGRSVVHPRGGAAYLGDDGTPLLDEPVHTWVTARTVHVYGLGVLLGEPGADEVADGALRGLVGQLHDDEHGGWFAGIDREGLPLREGEKACYEHAFVLLAASTATLAGRPGAQGLLAEAREVLLRRFWDERAGMCVDAWDRSWSTLDPYRGLNANMHAVEAMLATADVDGDDAWVRRALRIASTVVGVAEQHRWRIPEHYDDGWVPHLEHNRDHPRDPFKPYGATVGHGLEWSRLLVQLEAALPHGVSSPVDLLGAAEALFDRAVADGWAVDGADGFVYTTDWEGRPVVRERMHWVVAEAVCTAAVLWRRTGRPAYAEWYHRWWGYARTHLLDTERGSWVHELDPANEPATGTWAGKPDLYHAVQATLVPQLPPAPGLARALRDGALPR